MQKFSLAFAILVPMFFVGCEKATEAADKMTEAASQLDVSKLSPEALKTEGSKLVSELASKLGEIKDLAGAQSAAKSLEPMLANLGMLKDKLGLANMDMSSVQTAVSSLTAKFGSDGKIMEALKPLLEKIQGLLK